MHNVNDKDVLVNMMYFSQVLTLVTPEEQACVPGFEQNNLILRVPRKHLRPHVRLGKGKNSLKCLNIHFLHIHPLRLVVLGQCCVDM